MMALVTAVLLIVLALTARIVKQDEHLSRDSPACRSS